MKRSASSAIPQELDITTLLLIGVLAVLAHTSLLVVSRWLNVMLVLIAVYSLLSLLGSINSPIQMAAKWGRVYVNLLLIIIAVFIKREYRMGPAGIAFVGFAALYMLAGFYSSTPFTAVKYKGLYLVLVLSGIFTASSIKSERELRIGMRIMVIAGIVVASAMLFELVRNPAAMGRIGRFEPWGIVATRVGALCGPLGMICAFCALYDKSKGWKILSYAVGGILAILIVYSGSRGGLFMAGIGCFIIGLPIIKRPILATTSSVLVGIVAYIVLSFAKGSESAERFTEFNFDSRAEKWALAGEMFREKMFFGAGWVIETGKVESGSTANMHNMYNQIAVEMGLFGLTAFAIALVIIGFRSLVLIRNAKPIRRFTESTYLALGLICAVLAFGIVESGPIMGATTTGILLALAIGLVDRLNRLSVQERLAEADHQGGWDSWDEAEHEHWGPDGEDGWSDDPDENGHHDHAYEDQHDGDADEYEEQDWAGSPSPNWDHHDGY